MFVCFKYSSLLGEAREPGPQSTLDIGCGEGTVSGRTGAQAGGQGPPAVWSGARGFWLPGWGVQGRGQGPLRALSGCWERGQLGPGGTCPLARRCLISCFLLKTRHRGPEVLCSEKPEGLSWLARAHSALVLGIPAPWVTEDSLATCHGA